MQNIVEKPKKFYCGLCETSHHALVEQIICTACARYFCKQSIRSAQAVGLAGCPYCRAPLIQEERNAELSEVVSALSTDSDRERIEERPALESLLNPPDLRVFTFIEEDIGTELPFLEQTLLSPFDFGVIVNRGRITSVSLYDQNISEISGIFGQIAGLQALYLRRNQLSSLPETMKNLSHLETLDLSYNSFTKLPPFIGDLTSLNHLNLSHNLLGRLPRSLENISTLLSLDLRGNPCWERQRTNKLQAWVEKLIYHGCTVYDGPRIEYYHQVPLNEADTEFLLVLERTLGYPILPISLPQGWAQFQQNRLSASILHQITNLEKGFIHTDGRIIGLVLEEATLGTFPSVVEHLTELRVLILRDCKLAGFPHGIVKSQKLQVLGIIEGELTEIPRDIGSLRDLRILKLSGNNLVQLPKEICELNNLTVLELDHNNLVSLPSSLRRISSLRWLDFVSNPVWNNRSDRKELNKWLRQLHRTKCHVVGYHNNDERD